MQKLEAAQSPLVRLLQPMARRSLMKMPWSRQRSNCFPEYGGEGLSLIQAALYALSPNSSPSDATQNQSTSSKTLDDSHNKKSTSSSSSNDGIYTPTLWSGGTSRSYQYCLLGKFDDNEQERTSIETLCVAIQKKKGKEEGGADYDCRITLTLSPQSRSLIKRS